MRLLSLALTLSVALSPASASPATCHLSGARLPDAPHAENFCGGDAGDLEGYLSEPELEYLRETAAAAAQEDPPPIPKPSMACGGSEVVKGWCLSASPQTGKQPPPGNSFTDAQCCAWCVAEPTCLAWNTNSQQAGSAAGGCHLRSSLAAPNKGAHCHFGVVRTPAPAPVPKPAPKGARNILVLVTDDFRPFIEPWTDKYGIRAPNLKKLGTESMVFHNAYVQQAVCGPSRNSFLTGKRPDSTNVWTFANSFRTSGVDTQGTKGADWQTMPGVFKQNGYNTVGLGKIFHPGSPHQNDCLNPHPARAGVAPDCRAWSTEMTTPLPANITAIGNRPTNIMECEAQNGAGRAATCNLTYFQPDAQINVCAFKIGGKKWLPQACDVPDENCTDLWLADAAVRTLRSVAADKTKPFAMFVGFHKPHPFWGLPQRFQDEYLDTLPLPTHLDAPKDLPDVAYYSCTSVQGRSDMGGVNCDDAQLNPEGCQFIMPNASYAEKVQLNRTSMELMRKVRAGYAGGITWTDMQIGKVLAALDETGEQNNTLVIFWADHGWALGEQSMFCKMANFELQTRVPVLIRAPWLGPNAVGSTTAMVELADMFPTVVDLSGLGVQVDVSIGGPLALEGNSVAPLLEDPNLHVHSPSEWKRAAFSQYPRCMNSTTASQPPFLGTRDPCVGHTANQVTHMGYSMRTTDWRYAEWPAWKCHGIDGDVNWCSDMSKPGAVWSGSADWSELAGRELYAHTGDDGSCFDCYENENLVDQPQYKAVVEQLSKQLRAGWRGAAPVLAASA